MGASHDEREERKHGTMRIFENLGKKNRHWDGAPLPLPGTPFYQEGNVERALTKAVADATALITVALMVA
jgi:hypothetical protein